MLDLDFKFKDIKKNKVDISHTSDDNIEHFNLSDENITKKINLISEDKSDQDIKNSELEKSNEIKSTSVPFSQDQVASDQIKKAQERLERLEKFNHDLKDLDEQKLNHFENEPAYKRSGIELDTIENSSSENPISRLTLDEGDDEFKENNSFLHDNVD